jgi:hypothetical protein
MENFRGIAVPDAQIKFERHEELAKNSASTLAGSKPDMGATSRRAYADRIVVRMGDEIVAEHPRFFGRDRRSTIPGIICRRW